MAAHTRRETHCIVSILGLVLAALASASCGPRMPTADDARREYEAHRALIDRLDHGIASAVDEIPGIDTSHFACATDTSEQCVHERALQTAARREAMHAFAHDFLPSLARGTEVLGIRVDYAQDGVPRGTVGVLEADSAGGRIGSVAAGRGITVDDHSIGWGVYQTTWQRGDNTVRHGDARNHRGIEVIWRQVHGNARVAIRAVILTDGWHRPADWDLDLPPER